MNKLDEIIKLLPYQYNKDKFSDRIYFYLNPLQIAFYIEHKDKDENFIENKVQEIIVSNISDRGLAFSEKLPSDEIAFEIKKYVLKDKKRTQIYKKRSNFDVDIYIHEINISDNNAISCEITLTQYIMEPAKKEHFNKLLKTFNDEKQNLHNALSVIMNNIKIKNHNMIINRISSPELILYVEGNLK